MPKTTITIIGGGISGLSTGIRLLEKGHSVHIITKDLIQDTTSAIAAAIWFPFSAQPAEKVNPWSKRTYEVFQTLVDRPEAGVSIVTFQSLIASEDEFHWRNACPEGTIVEVPKEEVPEGYDLAYNVSVPLIESPIYMPFLKQWYESLGGTIEQRKVSSLEEFSTDQIVVNCTGLGAGELANDKEVYPIRGQIILVDPQADMPAFTDDYGPNRLAYAINRRDYTILGGTAQKGIDDLAIDPAESSAIHARCSAVYPQLKASTIHKTLVGLRPGRTAIRVEQEPDTNIVHNYGHGGSGYTVSWGCAEETVALVEAIV